MLHRIEGTAIYFIFLCFLHFVFVSYQSKKDTEVTSRSGRNRQLKNVIRKVKTPLTWYLLVTLCVPLVRRSVQGDLSGFFEHTIVVISVLIILLSLFFLLKSIEIHFLDKSEKKDIHEDFKFNN